MNAVRQLWASIPLNTRRRIGRPSKRSDKCTPNQFSSSKIRVPPVFLDGISGWENDPLSFFRESNVELDFDGSALAKTYVFLDKLEQRKEKDILRSRFVKVLYYRLKNRLSLSYVRSNNMETMAQIISRAGTASTDAEVIKKNISKWVKQGRKFDALCKDVNKAKSLEDTHLGVLFCLPSDIHDEL